MNPINELAIMLQRAKTHMEKHNLNSKFRGTYQTLSNVLFTFEQVTQVSAAALRDADDERMTIHVPDTDCPCANCGKVIPAGETAIRMGNDIYHDGCPRNTGLPTNRQADYRNEGPDSDYGA